MSLNSSSYVNFEEDKEEGTWDSFMMFLTDILCLGFKHIILVATFVFAIIVPLPPKTCDNTTSPTLRKSTYWGYKDIIQSRGG